MNKKQVFLFALATGLFLGGFFIFQLYNKPHKNYKAAEAAHSLSSDDLFNKFAAGEGQEYVNQVVEVEGIIEEIARLQDGSLGFILRAEEAMMGGVNARMSPDYSSEDLEEDSLFEGQRVKLKCRCLGFDEGIIQEVKLDNCFVIDENE
jgi:hypothetical protein